MGARPGTGRTAGARGGGRHGGAAGGGARDRGPGRAGPLGSSGDAAGPCLAAFRRLPAAPYATLLHRPLWCAAAAPPFRWPPQAEAAAALYRQALAAPNLAASGGAVSPDVLQRRADCTAGLARCSILLGEVERGMELAAASGSSPLLLQCAALLEGQGAGKAAAQLFALAGQHGRAAQLFLRSREFALLDGVMAHAGSPALWLQYAQAKEGEAPAWKN